MKPARFDFVRADDLAEAHSVLADAGSDARIIAGGQTLVPMLSMRLVRPAVLVDIMGIAALAEVAEDGAMLRVGAAVRQAALLGRAGLVETHPLLAAALPWVGHAQTRSRGTICGSLAHADPSAELALVLLALDGTVRLSSVRGWREVEADDFFTGLMTTARTDDELIEAACFPRSRPGQGFAFREYGRRHGDFAIVACAAVADDGGTRLAVGGVADRPVRRDLGSADGAALDDALDEFAWALEARDDLHATAAYRRGLVRRFGRAVVEEARRCRV